MLLVGGGATPTLPPSQQRQSWPPCPPTQPSKTPGTKPVKPAKPPAPSPAGATQFAGTNSTTPPPTTTPGTNPSNTKCPITRHCRGPLKIAVVEVRSSSRTSTSTHNPDQYPVTHTQLGRAGNSLRDSGIKRRCGTCKDRSQTGIR